MRPYLLVAASALAAIGCGENLTFDDVHVNRPPTLSLSTNDVVEGSAAKVSVTAADADGNEVTVSYATEGPAGWVDWPDDTFTGGVAGETKEHERATTCADLGEHVLIASATDGLAATTEQVTLEVRHDEAPPQFDRTQMPSTVAWVDTQYSYRAKARSANECDNVLIKLQDAPAGMTIRRVDGESGPGIAVAVLEWTPLAAQSGVLHNVVLLAEDAVSQTDVLDWQISMNNRAPVVTESPPGLSHWKVGLPGERLYEAVDDDGHDIHRWDLRRSADGMAVQVVDTDTGKLTWTAMANQMGEHSFAIVAVDSEGAESAELAEKAFVWKDDDNDRWCAGAEPAFPERPANEGWCANGFDDCDDRDDSIHEGCN